LREALGYCDASSTIEQYSAMASCTPRRIVGIERIDELSRFKCPCAQVLLAYHEIPARAMSMMNRCANGVGRISFLVVTYLTVGQNSVHVKSITAGGSSLRRVVRSQYLRYGDATKSYECDCVQAAGISHLRDSGRGLSAAPCLDCLKYEYSYPGNSLGTQLRSRIFDAFVHALE
jgi:hypothetical protein